MALYGKSVVLRKVALIAIIWSLVGSLLFAYAHSYLNAITAGELPEYYNPGLTLVGFIASSFAAGLVFGYLIVTADSRKRRRSFGREILATLVWLVSIYLASIILPTVIFTLTADGPKSLSVVAGNLLATFNTATFVSLLVWIIIVGLTQFVLQINRKLGQGVLWNFVTGRYFHPREEHRTFMFLDLNDSTAIAEKIGHRRFFDLLSEFMGDVAEPIIRHKGRIYSYVGDEVIVYWIPESSNKNANPFRCFFAIEERIESLADKYQTEFDLLPEFKAAIHTGNVTIGEMGLIKKDIVFSGDTLNTTARILSECKRTGYSLLTSVDALSISEGDAEFDTTVLETLRLRGKQEPVQLVGVSQRLTGKSLPAAS